MLEINEQDDLRKEIAINYKELWTIPDRAYIARIQLLLDFPPRKKGGNQYAKKVILILSLKIKGTIEK